MATPSGHVYCKECIVEFLLTKTQELKRQKEAFEEQEKNKVTEEVTADEGRRVEAESSFVSTQLVIVKPQAQRETDKSVEGNGKGKGKKRGREEKSTGQAGPSKDGNDAALEMELTRRAVLMTKKERVEQLRTTSWWLPQFQPERVEDKIVQPPKRPGSPMSGEPLRPKDLIPIIFTLDSEKAKTAHISGGDGNRGSIICPVTRKGIISQKAILIKKSGHVILEDAVKQFALPTMTCPVTGAKFKTKDLVALVSGGTSFTASGQVEVTKYAPGLR
eukprot:jgi/Undpi1/9371/HiC_scaffold_26.g11829.m1